MTSNDQLNRRRVPRARIAVAAVIVWLLAGGFGCSRQTIQGTVTLDDRPLAQGYINFRPMPGAKGPPVGGPIDQGKYLLQPNSALEGDFRVEITMVGKTGAKTRDDRGHQIDIEGQVLPARYNTESKLQAQIKPGRRNEFPFSVTSK